MIISQVKIQSKSPPLKGDLGGCKKIMNKKILQYNPKLKEFARKLRNQSTLAEVLLWKRLRGKQIRGYQFL
jgi:hypothetical protein